MTDADHSPSYGVMHGWLVEHTNEHTCGAGVGVYSHEPGCGTEPIGPIEELLAAAACGARIRALFANGGPDGALLTRTTWIGGVEHIQVPVADLRAALDGPTR